MKSPVIAVKGHQEQAKQDLQSRPRTRRTLKLLAQDAEDSVHIALECPQSFTTFPLQSSLFPDDNPEFAFSVEEMVNGQVFSPSDPLTDQQADASPDKEYWVAARAEELSAHLLNGTYSEPIELPRGQQFTNTGFIYKFKTKLNSNGEVKRYKARLVFKNHRFSNPTKTWDEVFSPVVDKSTLRIFLSFAAQRKYFIRQIDIVTAFLNAPLPDICYVKTESMWGSTRLGSSVV